MYLWEALTRIVPTAVEMIWPASLRGGQRYLQESKMAAHHDRVSVEALQIKNQELKEKLRKFETEIRRSCRRDSSKWPGTLPRQAA